MALVVVTAVFLLASVGVYLLLARRTFPTVLGLGLLAHAVNLVVLCAGRVRPLPPIVEGAAPGPAVTDTMADPMPQALVLTAIVISMAVTLYLVAVMGTTAKRLGIVDVTAMPSGERDDDPRGDSGGDSKPTEETTGEGLG